MNLLATEKRCQVVAALVEGVGINAISRMTGVSKCAILKLLADIGEACAEYHDKNVRRVRVHRLQCDEIWQFIGAKRKNVTPEQEIAGWGDAWTWVGIDADTKLIVSYFVGDRDKGAATEFIHDCAERIIGRPQITTDALRHYANAIEDAFGADADYAMLHKLYGAPTPDESRYSPATCIGADMKVVSGNPDPKHVSTSYVERQNLTMRMHMRRFTRLTNGFSKKFDNHVYAVALHFMHYNFCRVHQTLRITPAMAAGLTDHVWSIEELCALLPKPVVSESHIEREMLRKALGE